MSSTTTDQQFLNAKANLPEPHFDEEATMLSARPVVPLDEVRASKGGTVLARPWIVGLSVAGALLVGVLATALYFSRSTEDNSVAVEGIEASSGAAGMAEEPVNGFSGPALEQPKVETKQVAVDNQAAEDRQPVRSTSKVEKKIEPRLVAVIRDRKSNHTDDQESLEDRKEARRQERRERRRAGRERRGGRSADELLRIRDIFEGSPRP